MVASAAHPIVLRRVRLRSAKKALKMSSTTGSWMIAVGALAAVIGLLMLPAALGEHPDTSLLLMGACGVSMGSMIAASGIYLKARALQSSGASVKGAAEPKDSTRRVRGGCDVCHGDLPVIHCKVHQVHLCGKCLGRHYDFRTCAYAPSTRGASAKTATNLTRARGASSR
jgi:hypothetical protein